MRLFRAFALLATLATMSVALAAQGLESRTYQVTMPDGKPIQEGLEVQVDIRETAPGEFSGHVYFRREGDDWRESPGELTTYWEVMEGVYYWENARGATGVMAWDANKGQFHSTVLTGRYAGQERALH